MPTPPPASVPVPRPGAPDSGIGLDEVALLARLVATPSVSGDETAVAELIEAEAVALGLEVVRDDACVRILVPGQAEGKTLALVSHLDVVPPGEGWTLPPFTPKEKDNRLYGRGACDAKASVAAMVAAALDVQRAGGPRRGRLLVVLGYSEETRDTSMPRAVPRLGPLDAAVIGEPTGLDLAIAQRGLMVVELHAHGEQRHAAYSDESGGYRSAVLELARDLCCLPALLQDRPHALLGQPTLTPTRLEAFVARNVAPPVAKALLDLRTTPAWPHAEVAAALRAGLRSQVEVVSERLQPCATPASSRLLAAAQTVRPLSRCYGSPTCSDWVFVRHLDAIKCGPGDSVRSHTPDEFVELDQVRAARRFYAELAQEYLS